jgi:hypothetical protein
MLIKGIEFVVEEKTGIGYTEGEAIQIYPANGEYPDGGMHGAEIANAVRPGCKWSYSGKDLSESERITTILIWN